MKKMRTIYKYNYIYIARDRALSDHVGPYVRRCEINVGQFVGSDKYYHKTK